MTIFRPNSYFVLFRHAEAIKNLEKMHGGGTQALTELGKAQIEQSALELTRWFDANDIGGRRRIFFQTEERSEYTARLLSHHLGIRANLAEGISGVGLGIVASLNEDELKKQYPKVATALDNWRAGANGLVDYPKIPGSEPMIDFAARIGAGLNKIAASSGCPILVGTTSVINMVNHLLENQGYFIREKYEFVTYQLGGFTIWNIDQNASPAKIFSNFI